MALQTSGAISLNQIHIEAGGSSGTSVTINDADIRGLTAASGYTIPTSSGSTIDFGDFYGASSGYVITEGTTTSGDLDGYSQINGSFGSINNSTWNSATIIQVVTFPVVFKYDTSYYLSVVFSGNQTTSIFSTISLAGVSHSMVDFSRSYDSSNTRTSFTKNITSSQQMDGSGTTAVEFT